jgi:hypothetical protein
MNPQFLQGRITATQNQIIAYEAAIDALVAGGAQNYMLDTGQSRQSVTKLDLATLQKNLDAMYNRLVTLEARLNGSGTVTTRPAW